MLKKAIVGRRAQESWSEFKDRLLQAEEQRALRKRESKQECQVASADQQVVLSGLETGMGY